MCEFVRMLKKRVDSLITETTETEMKKRNDKVDFLFLSLSLPLLVISKLSNDIICPLKNDNITQLCLYLYACIECMDVYI